jgi:hypothetical protein
MSQRVPDFCIGAGDELADIPATFVDKDGAAVNITGATVRFRVRSRWASAVLLDEVATIVDAASGTVKYEWAAGDTDGLAVGDNWAQFDATIGAERFTAPNNGMLLVRVGKVIA